MYGSYYAVLVWIQTVANPIMAYINPSLQVRISLFVVSLFLTQSLVSPISDLLLISFLKNSPLVSHLRILQMTSRTWRNVGGSELKVIEGGETTQLYFFKDINKTASRNATKFSKIVRVTLTIYVRVAPSPGDSCKEWSWCWMHQVIFESIRPGSGDNVLIGFSITCIML